MPGDLSSCQAFVCLGTLYSRAIDDTTKGAIMRPARYAKFPLAFLLACLVALLCLKPILLADEWAIHRAGDRALGMGDPNARLAQTIDVFTGTGARAALPAAYSGGETFPGADVPFGMVQWSPDTVKFAYSEIGR